MPVYPNHRAIFAHIPKTGGSTITSILGRGHLFQRVEVDPHTKGHTSIFRQLEVAGEEVQDYYKFAFVRNPWDRLVSAYHYIIERRTDLTAVTAYATFDDFIAAFSQQPELFFDIYYFQTQHSFLFDDQGQTPIDFFGRFENFGEDLQHVLQHLSVQKTLVRHRKRSKRTDYRDYFNDQSRDAVAKIYQQDIDTFEYTFENGQQRSRSFFLQRLRKAS